MMVRRFSARRASSVDVPPAINMTTLTPRTSNAPAAFPTSPMPAATPRYAEAGIVVTEMATPTAELGLV